MRTASRTSSPGGVGTMAMPSVRFRSSERGAAISLPVIAKPPSETAMPVPPTATVLPVIANELPGMTVPGYTRPVVTMPPSAARMTVLDATRFASRKAVVPSSRTP